MPVRLGDSVQIITDGLNAEADLVELSTKAQDAADAVMVNVIIIGASQRALDNIADVQKSSASQLSGCSNIPVVRNYAQNTTQLAHKAIVSVRAIKEGLASLDPNPGATKEGLASFDPSPASNTSTAKRTAIPESAAKDTVLPCNSHQLHDKVPRETLKHVSQIAPDGEVINQIDSYLKLALSDLHESNSDQDCRTKQIMADAGQTNIHVCRSSAEPIFFVEESTLDGHIVIGVGNYGIAYDNTIIREPINTFEALKDKFSPERN